MSTEDLVIVSQPTGSRTLALRESYLAICDGDSTKALLLNANERWYRYKLKEREQSRHRNRVSRDAGEPEHADEGLWVFMSGEQWAAEILGVAEVKSVRRKLDSLVEQGFLKVRDNPHKRWDKKKQWLFMRGKVQAAVDAWAAARASLPDIDPGPSDDLPPEGPGPGRPENSGPADQDTVATSIRTIVRMQADRGESPSGQLSECTRTKGSSNTTGFLHRDLSLESFSGGEYNVTDNAHAHAPAEPTTPVAEPSPAPVTTTVAAREALGGLSAPVASVAVVSPDGEAADAAITDTELEFLFGNQAPATQEPGMVTEVQEVPGGPAAPRGAQEAQEGPSDSELAPHDPESTRRVLTPALGGPKKLTALMTETPPGLKAGSRQDWVTRIRPERAGQIIAAARLEAGADNPWTYIIRHLDQEIGAQFRRGTAGQSAVAVVPNGASLDPAVPLEVVADVAPTDGYGVGARWQARSGGEVITIARTSQTPTRHGSVTLYHLSNGQELKAFELLSRYDQLKVSA
ncbi:hypothetical protein IHN32_00740 [Deinococcus sp. 14RED07]|uniref:hypothetical protein n=1 Tax=Deinococcus sp. 14RED07 TaxID=2745874 RepID=UPI001E3DA593|nr:hypothetical protein [Deinococcus sp. 14RED07]MCD0174482.1 hypothetical protein [Deinococcus sp. 14RED07]